MLICGLWLFLIKLTYFVKVIGEDRRFIGMIDATLYTQQLN